tara:strand:+ start:697 stop:924 length:228 start_codon:yes stop_codon:yes gene_type:complete
MINIDLPEPRNPSNISSGTQAPTDQRRYYYDIAHQLDCLWHDIDSGLLGEQAKTGAFYQFISEIKAAIPKTQDSV